MATALGKILYDSRLADATPVASTTAAGFSVLNLRDWRPYTWWKPTALPATVTVDCGSAKAADYALLYGHDLFTQSATVEIRGSTDNFSASNVLVASLTPSSNQPQLIQFSSVSYRYWRLRFTGSTMPSIAIAALGAALSLPKFLRLGFDPLAREVMGEGSNRSADGHPLGRVVTHEMWRQQIEVRNATWSWVRASFLPAWRAHLRGTPFVFAWDPGDYPDELRLVQAATQVSAAPKSGGLLDLSFGVEGVHPL